MNNELFKREEDKLLKFILNERFFQPFRNPSSSLSRSSRIELYITNQCNQHCEYCYLYNNSKIYPPEGNNPENICKNLRILLEYFLINNFCISGFSLFSGEIYHTQFGRDFLSIILNYIRRGLNVREITIPTNGSFILNDESLFPILDFINKYEEHGVSLIFSLSIDGKIIDEINRPKNDTSFLFSDEYYEKIFNFARTTGSKFHPMVAAVSIEKWKENFEWWKEQTKRYGFEENAHSLTMLLEVRNNDWTDEKIQKYCDFLEYLVDDFYTNVLLKDKDMLYHYFLGDGQADFEGYGYIPWILAKNSRHVSCSICQELCIRLGDLAICPCHRTAYNKNLYGNFVVKNNEIVDIEANNPALAGRILLGNNVACSPKCDTCEYGDFCIQGCLGSQLEQHKDLLIPIENLCKFFKAKAKTIIKIYEKYGCFEYCKKLNFDDSGYSTAQDLLKLRESLQDEK